MYTPGIIEIILALVSVIGLCSFIELFIQLKIKLNEHDKH